MTVTTQVNKITANGNGVARTFSFSPIVINQSSELEVTHVVDATGVETLLSEGTSATTYSVTATNYPTTGSIEYPAVGGTLLPSGESLVIKRVLTLEQQTALQNQGGYFPKTQEEQFDRFIMIDLQQQELIDRAVLLPISSALSGLEFPTPLASTPIGWNAAADNLANITSLGDALAVPIAVSDGGTGGTSVATAQQGLDLEVGVDVQAWDTVLDSISALSGFTDNAILRADGTVGVYQNSGWTVDDSDVMTSGGQLTMAHTLQLADNSLLRAKLGDTAELVNNIGAIGGGTQDIDFTLGHVVLATVDTSTTTFTFSNPPATGIAGSFTLVLTNGGSQTVNWPASVDWAGAVAPTLTAAGVDVLSFFTNDAGTIWYGFLSGLDMS